MPIPPLYMKFEITLNEQDYLIHTLFVASKSNRAKRNRNRTVILMFILCLVISLNSYLSNKFGLAIFFLIFSAVSILLYPVYQQWLYKRHYLKNINETYKNRFGKVCEIEFNEDFLITKDSFGEGKMNLNALEHIYEISQYFLLKFSTGETLILPKNQIPTDHFSLVLSNIIAIHHIEFSQELNWKWK